VAGDLLRAALGGDVLGAGERGAPALVGQVAQVLGDERDGAARAPLPRRVGGGVDDDLADDAPPGVARLAAADEEARERLGDEVRVGLGAVGIEVAQRLADAAAAADRAGELGGGAPRRLS
jgi:hypothetical protein